MSAGTSGDVSLINDEDLLRKMWQETEDFGRKKEIRAHMYKLREARLRDFYNSGEVNTDIQRTATRMTTESKLSSIPTHADSLADHSFISMKTKEIRDSESPTRDVNYRIIDNKLGNQGWNVVSSNKISDDGKTFTTSKVASTSGTEKFEGGVLDYAAQNEQSKTVFEDGDERNYSKAVGASSNTVIKQDACGGDENRSFKSSSTKTSSSSHYVAEQKSSSDDIDNKLLTSESGQRDKILVHKKNHPDNIPEDFENDPSFADGKTKVTRQTKTMPDGTIVTTTKYETTGGSSVESSKRKQYSTTHQKSSASSVNKTQVVDSKTNKNDLKTTKYLSDIEPSNISTTITKHIYTSEDKPDSNLPATKTTTIDSNRNECNITQQNISQKKSLQSATSHNESNFFKQVSPSQPSTTTTIIRRVYDSDELQPVTTTVVTNRENQEIDLTDKLNDRITTRQESYHKPLNKIEKTTRTTVYKTISNEPSMTVDDSSISNTSKVIKRTTENKNVTNVDRLNSSNLVTSNIKQIEPTIDSKTVTRTTVEESKLTTTEHPSESTVHRIPQKEPKIDSTTVVTTTVEDSKLKTIEHPSESTLHRIPQKEIPYVRPDYEVPDRRQPIKPEKSELDEQRKPTEGQYETTYRTDYTNKKISVEVNPTHEAFARSLRAVTPDRISKGSSPSRSSLRTSTNSLRTSASPEKKYISITTSPERRSVSPKKCVSNETITYRTNSRKNTTIQKDSDAKINSSTLTRQKNKAKVRSRTPSPTTTASEIEFIRHAEIITDLDTNVTTVVRQSKPVTLEIVKKTTKKVTDRSPTSPFTDVFKKSPTHNEAPRRSSLRNHSPQKETSHVDTDRSLKRTDKYEARCREILGIKSETIQRKNSLERTTNLRKVSKSPEKIAPTKTTELPDKEPLKKGKSPVKETSKPILEKDRPSQTRQSPKKEPLVIIPLSSKPSDKESTIINKPSLVRQSPVRESIDKIPGRRSSDKERVEINKFSSRVRESFDDDLSDEITKKKHYIEKTSNINETFSRRNLEKEPLNHFSNNRPSELPKNKLPSKPSSYEKNPEQKRLGKASPKLSEFPSQNEFIAKIRQSPEKEVPKISEFPSQIGKSPEKETVRTISEKSRPDKESSKISEFPSQVRRSPNKEIRETPERRSPTKESLKYSSTTVPHNKEPVEEKRPVTQSPKVDKFFCDESVEGKAFVKKSTQVNEFLSDIRRSADEEISNDIVERNLLNKESPKISEFSSQIRKSPEKETVITISEKRHRDMESSKISEFPSQVRPPPNKETRETPEQRSPTKESSKYSSTTVPHSKQPVEKKHSVTQSSKIDKFFCDESVAGKAFVKKSTQVNEFLSEIRRSADEEIPNDIVERNLVSKESPKISEFPSQIRKSPEKETVITISEKRHRDKESSKISEFPSQVRPSPNKETRETPEQRSPTKESPKYSSTTVPHNKEPVEKKHPVTQSSKIDKFFLDETVEEKDFVKKSTQVNEFHSEIRESAEEEIPNEVVERNVLIKESPKISEFPSQIRKSPEKETMITISEKRRPEKESPKISEFPSQIRRSPNKESRETPEQQSFIKESPKYSSTTAPYNKEPVDPKEKRPVAQPSKIDKFYLVETVTGKEREKEISQVNKFLSEIRQSPEKETKGITSKTKLPNRESPKITEWPSHVERPNKPEELFPKNRRPLTASPNETRAQEFLSEETSTIISELASQDSQLFEKEPLEEFPDTYKSPCQHLPGELQPDNKKLREKTRTDTPTKLGATGQLRRSVEREIQEQATEKRQSTEDVAFISDLVSQGQQPITIKKYIDKTKHNTAKNLVVDETLEKIKSEKEKLTKRPSSVGSPKKKEVTEKINTVTQISNLGAPVSEPLVTKKFIRQLCKDDEIQRTDLLKKKSQDILKTTKESTSVKKNAAKNSLDTFIRNEQTDTTTKTDKYSVRNKPSVKKQLTERNDILKSTTTIKVDKKTTTKSKDDKPKIKEKITYKNTLIDSDRTNKTKEDKQNYTKAHNINDVIIKRGSKHASNNEVIIQSSAKHIQRNKTTETETRKSVEKKPQSYLFKIGAQNEPKRLPSDQKAPKRHIVTTMINVNLKPQNKSTVKSKTTISKTVFPAKTTQKPKFENGNISSEDESIADSLDEEYHQKATLSSEHNICTNNNKQTKTQKSSANTEIHTIDKKSGKKCITTKSIIINNEPTTREIVVDLQRSKSSREPTPDRICPLPVTSDDESIPRYPDKIAEPEDTTVRRTSKKLSHIPIFEGENTDDFKNITEIINSSRESLDNVTRDDVSLLSIDKKINKFSDSTPKNIKAGKGVVPKVERPIFEVSDDLQSDECLLSVSQKVNKFITTAEQLTAPQDNAQRPKSPKCQYYPDRDNVSDKVSHFITTAEKIFTSDKASTGNTKEFHAEKVSKFVRPGDKLIDNTKTNISLSKMDTTTPDGSQPSEPIKKTILRKKSPRETSPIMDSYEKIDVESNSSRQNSSKEISISRNSTISDSTTQKSALRNKSPYSTPISTKYPSGVTSVSRSTQENKRDQKANSPKLPDSTPKSTRRLSEEKPKSELNTTSRLRSTENVKKAKTLFENINADQQNSGFRNLLNRPSVLETRRFDKTQTAKKLTYDTDEDEKVLMSTKLLLDNVRSRSKSPDKLSERINRRSQTPDSDVPGYMKPLDRSLRPNSPHREHIGQPNKISTVKNEENVDVKQTNFGVILKRTNLGKALPFTSPIKSPIIEDITETEIKEIYNLEILEQLLEKIVSYELRRKIRAQVRLVKKYISEGRLSETTTNKVIIKGRSPEKQTTKTERATSNATEVSTSYSYSERRSSTEYSEVVRRSPVTQLRRSKSPDKSPTRSSKTVDTKTKKSTLLTKSIEDNTTPEWVKQRNLKKVTDRTDVTTKRTSKTLSYSPTKESKSTDIITSSYGIGPTDENGSPLFGLKALRAKNKTDTTKVQGTVIRSQYYSENGQEPVGEVSITKYSTDPRDLGRSEDDNNQNVTRITTTQKFGYKDTPSLKTLTDTTRTKQICDEFDETNKSKSTKISRRGSVKAISQKFTDNNVEVSKVDKQSSYPKAGLILRTSSFKESTSGEDNREDHTEKTVTMKTSSTRTVTGDTFLTNRNKVTGVQDVISRMKTEEIREGDSAEDVEARNLLNKFIGSQVILSGLESNVETLKTTNARRSTKITTTITEGGKPTTRTRIFQHPINDEELRTVWDEETLRLLLEQSTDYEERRNIRARLRQVMAEQEACTELVEKATQDQIGTSFEETTQIKESSKVEPVTTSHVTTRITTQQITKKPISPFAKFRQLDKQNSQGSSPSTPKTPSSSGPLFKFTDPAVSQSASTIKDRLLHWCRMKTKEYENIQLDNFSTSWADGLAFCALIHHFLPDSFDYHALSPKNRRHNFTLAFKVADEKADIAPLLDVDDMVATRKPDWKCVFTYVQSIYRRFKDED